MYDGLEGGKRMNYTVKQVADTTGISVRTLHYYDEIGLLRPSSVTDAGYRLYDEDCLERLQQIMFFRELDFPLKDIIGFINRPEFNKHETLRKQRELLLLRRERLDGLIALVDKALKGENDMSFKEFDMTEIENIKKKYADEVQERWGGTQAFEESQKKTAEYKKSDWERISKETDRIFSDFAAHMKANRPPSDPEVQKTVADWQSNISKNFYNCTNEILAGLGAMYVNDRRFTDNIDKYADGLASYISQAIEAYI